MTRFAQIMAPMFCVCFTALVGATDEPGSVDGTWIAVRGKLNGVDTPPPEAGVEIAFSSRAASTAGAFIMKNDGKVTDSGTFEVDSSKSPKRIELTHSIGPSKGRTGLGIYKFKGKELWICMGAEGNARPTDFSCPPSADHFLMIWKRSPKKAAENRLK